MSYSSIPMVSASPELQQFRYSTTTTSCMHVIQLHSNWVVNCPLQKACSQRGLVGWLRG